MRDERTPPPLGVNGWVGGWVGGGVAEPSLRPKLAPPPDPESLSNSQPQTPPPQHQNDLQG